MNVTPVTGAISVADQPSLEELRALSEDGYVAVVNLRHAGEPEQPLDPEAEGREANAAGLAYLHVEVGGAPLTAEGVEQFDRFLDDQVARGKVLVHCRKGGRAAAMTLVYLARKEGWPMQEAVEKGRERGLNVEGNLKIMVELFLAQQAMKAE